MSRIRVQKVSEQMKKELADIVRSSVKDPRVGFATITRVEVSGDLQHAKVYVSVLGSEDERSATISALSKAAGFIRGEVARRLHMRVAPELAFRLDDSGEYSARIEHVLKTIRTGDSPSTGE
ncbi:30S ribosome-binding factor RbfA [Alicyclobacillus fastidiosus]|uniref:Ribosome-binding factor A n=1 Tax=Alicyclobacillus fastidiosus TaxID=392011 RepID=A0ABV5AHF6_9BACL|nr:30S ribosome-binding factor RbfA [Alicyclobacillus fastidiosus]WEH07890.1 30S ribosome-binding factor RbfA [Alicyclobacillus fastidiosus]